MYSKTTKTNEFNAMLMSNETRQKMLAKLNTSKKYKYCLIRIKFPDELILQGTFRPSDSTSKVFDFVKENLILPDLPYELVEPPNSMLSREGTLEKYTPSSIFNFKIDNGLLNDVREQTGSLHLVRKELLSNIKEL